MHSETDAVATGGIVGTPAVQEGEETDDEELADWQALSLVSMWEYWDNEEDAVYDNL